MSARPLPSIDAPAFAVERFAWTAPDRLEVRGHWSGVRGRRFMRPTLDLLGVGDQRRLLAVLDHKPWEPAGDGAWVAAFPWDGDPIQVTSAELAVAPGVVVVLGAPGAADGTVRPDERRDTSAAVPASSASSSGTTSEHAALRQEVEAVRGQRDRALEALRAERESARTATAERDALQTEHVDANAQRAEADALRAERDRLRSAYDLIVGERETLRAELAAASVPAPVVGDPQLHEQIATLGAERDVLTAEVARLTAERDAALAEPRNAGSPTTAIDVLLARVLAAGAVLALVVLAVLVVAAAL